MGSGSWDDAFDLPDASGADGTDIRAEGSCGHCQNDSQVPQQRSEVAVAQTSSWDGAFEQEAPQAPGDAAHADPISVAAVSVATGSVRRGPGRPKGSTGTASQRRQWAKRAASDAALDHDDDAEAESQHSGLTGIERARAAKAAKREERKQENKDSASILVHQSENASDGSSMTLSMLSSDSKVWNCMLALAAEEDTSQVQRVSWNLLVGTTEILYFAFFLDVIMIGRLPFSEYCTITQYSLNTLQHLCYGHVSLGYTTATRK